jgi:hypothetical protein
VRFQDHPFFPAVKWTKGEETVQITKTYKAHDAMLYVGYALVAYTELFLGENEIFFDGI